MNSDDALIEALRDFIPRAMAVDAPPGVSIAVARHGEVIWQAGFGWADVAAETPMTADTVGRAGSMGKLYTAVAVMQMVEQGRLDLDRPVASYVDLAIENPLGDRPITARDFMHHRSGLTSDSGGCDHVSVPPLEQFLREGYASDMLDEYEGSVPRWSAKVGKHFQYSNFGLATLGYLVEVTNAEGLSCSDYIRSHILAPLGMDSSDYPPLHEAGAYAHAMARCSTGYTGFGELLVATPPVMFGSYPAGALFTTPGDHLKLMLALAGGGTHGGVRILRQESLDEMLRPAVDCGEGLHTGLVVRMSNLGALDEHFHHWGAFMWGWHNGSAVFPRLDLAIVILTNSWGMLDYLDPAAPSVITLITDFASGWCTREALGLEPSEQQSWAWKTSYAVGLAMVDRNKGVLGIRDAMAGGVVEDVVARTPPQPRWDPDGFRAGVADMLAVPQNPDSVAHFLSSPDPRVSPAELALIHVEMGARGPFSLPPEIGSWLLTA